MPIVEFSNNQQLENWINECTSPDKYRILVTSEKEVIVRPTKATDTLDFGYLRFLTMEKLEGTVAKLVEQGYTFLDVKCYHWDKERFNYVIVS